MKLLYCVFNAFVATSVATSETPGNAAGCPVTTPSIISSGVKPVLFDLIYILVWSSLFVYSHLRRRIEFV